MRIVTGVLNRTQSSFPWPFVYPIILCDGMDNIRSTPFRRADFIIPGRVQRTGSSFRHQGGQPLMRTRSLPTIQLSAYYTNSQ